MANHAYLSLWLEDSSENALQESFHRFLETIPFSEQRPGFTELVVRAVSPAEAPIVERDLRAPDVDANAIAGIIAEQFHSDSSYEVGTWWDLWFCEAGEESGGKSWKLGPKPLVIICNGDDYDDGIARETGHIQVDVGFEELYAGGGNMESRSANPAGTTNPGSAPQEASQEKVRSIQAARVASNIRKLMGWAEQARETLKVKRYQIWSEGDENFEARLEESLAAR